MSSITIQKTKADAASQSLQVTVPADRVKAAEAKAVRFYSQRAKVPGFRPGKTPEAVLRKRFGDAIRQSVLEEVIRESWEEAQNTEGLKPVAEPHIHNLKFEEGGPIEFEFHVEVRPTIALGKTGGFKLKRKVAAVTAEAVEERLRDLRERKATWLPVEGAKPSPGHQVRVEVAPLEDGVAGPTQPYSMVLGEGRAIPELEERIMALLPGETVDTSVKFPEDFSDESKRGQTRQVRVTLHEVKRQELPELNDDLAREIGDFENLDALRAALRQDLEEDAKRNAEAEVRQALVEELVKANGVEAPPSMVERFLRGYARGYQIPDEQFETFAAEFRPLAEAQVRRDLALDAVAEANKLYATESDMDARIKEMAEARHVSEAQLYASLEKANRLRELEHSITEEKTFAHLLPQSTVEESAS
ncbi:MAG TPA: trigger factor [Gemmatimonadales bacterium]|nr:trigger factor [Gemmatimonadales bacterium]